MTLKKAKIYFTISVATSLLSLFYVLFTVGVFRKDALFVEALSCTCPDYKVVFGSYKIKSPLLDTLTNVDVSEIFISGSKNPYSDQNYLAYYDYFLIDIKIVGVKKLAAGDPNNPVIKVSNWARVNYLTFVSVLILLITSFLLTLFYLIQLRLLKKKQLTGV